MDKKFDIIIYGATGFTGQLCVKYLSKNANDINWAIAGRNIDKLNAIRANFLVPNLPIVVADSNDLDSIDEMTKKAKVICTTVGPYAKLGTSLVKMCIKNGTHYCDLAGEV